MDAHDGNPAAGLHHERRGAGPPLLIIPGASGGSAIFGALADALAGRYTVLTYDRRGHGRSGPDAGFSVAGHAADARAVIEANGFGSAIVLGCSAGAIIGLDLAARFPALVSVLVAYEPPLFSVLPNARLRIALRRAELRLRWRRSPGATVFLTREARSVYAWDPGQLAGIRVPLIFGGGRYGRNTLPYGIARMLAGRLGARFAEFPGGHRGAMTHPAEFAAALTEALAASSAGSQDSDGTRRLRARRYRQTRDHRPDAAECPDKSDRLHDRGGFCAVFAPAFPPTEDSVMMRLVGRPHWRKGWPR